MASAAVIWEDILGDLLTFGTLAASIFVKNAAHQAIAQKVIQAVNVAIPVVQSQLVPAAPTAIGPAPTTGPNS